MKKYQEVMDILSRNLVDNSNMINFINNYEISRVIIDGKSVLVQGLSDES